jgi:hypothetical protein
MRLTLRNTPHNSRVVAKDVVLGGVSRSGVSTSLLLAAFTTDLTLAVFTAAFGGLTVTLIRFADEKKGAALRQSIRTVRVMIHSQPDDFPPGGIHCVFRRASVPLPAH